MRKGRCYYPPGGRHRLVLRVRTTAQVNSHSRLCYLRTHPHQVVLAAAASSRLGAYCRAAMMMVKRIVEQLGVGRRGGANS
jgi:hypothetical protein